MARFSDKTTRRPKTVEQQRAEIQREAGELGKKAADTFEQAVDLAGKHQGTGTAKQATHIAEGILAGMLARQKE